MDAPKFTVTVTTIIGAFNHQYPLPQEPEEMAKLMDDVMVRVKAALTDRASCVGMEYPDVVYRGAHIVAVKFDIPQGIEIKRPLGFLHT